MTAYKSLVAVNDTCQPHVKRQRELTVTGKRGFEWVELGGEKRLPGRRVRPLRGGRVVWSCLAPLSVYNPIQCDRSLNHFFPLDHHHLPLFLLDPDVPRPPLSLCQVPRHPLSSLSSLVSFFDSRYVYPLFDSDSANSHVYFQQVLRRTL